MRIIDLGAVAPADSPELLLYARFGFDRHLVASVGVRLVGLRDVFGQRLEFERSTAPTAPGTAR